jgi:glycosyltransferase involved in cell wall biosynthesis
MRRWSTSVVDGGSTDGTLDLLRASSARWISEPDRGQTDAPEQGLRLAQGEIIGWVNADDTYAPGAVAAAVEHLLAELGIGLVFADCLWIDAAGDAGSVAHAADHARRPAARGCIIAHQSAFVRARCSERGRV